MWRHSTPQQLSPRMANSATRVLTRMCAMHRRVSPPTAISHPPTHPPNPSAAGPRRDQRAERRGHERTPHAGGLRAEKKKLICESTRTRTHPRPHGCAVMHTIHAFPWREDRPQHEASLSLPHTLSHTRAPLGRHTHVTRTLMPMHTTSLYVQRCARTARTAT
jgi:hypothetical protein